MTETEAQRQKEIQQAEELLFTGPQALGFVKGLFQSHFVSDWVMPYPRIAAAEQPKIDQTLSDLRKFLDEHLDAAEIDRQADIPRDVIDGLGRGGVLGMTAPREDGGGGGFPKGTFEDFGEIRKRWGPSAGFFYTQHSTWGCAAL